MECPEGSFLQDFTDSKSKAKVIAPILPPVSRGFPHRSCQHIMEKRLKSLAFGGVVIGPTGWKIWIWTPACNSLPDHGLARKEEMSTLVLGVFPGI